MMFRLSAIAIFLILLSSCGSGLTDKSEAQQDILVATLFRMSECGPGSGPGFILPVMKDQDINAVAGCVIAIVDAPCPFKDYPLLCIRVFGMDVPGTVKIVTQ